MAFVLGIDIGTSFSAAAVARLDGAGQPAPQVLNLGVRGGAVPSVIFLGEDGQVLVGEAAERRGTTHPDRLVREFKRRVGDAVPIVVGDLSVAPEDIVATMARWVVDRAQEREGEPPAAIAIAHPASWGGYKKDLVRQALAGVGLAEVTLVSEPEAAAVHYASQERVDEGSTVAVYDLGGGTFDAAVLQKSSAETFRTLGRPEGIDRLGGADFDDAVFRHVAACAADSLTGLDTSDPGVLMALARLRRECTEAKEALSTDSEASIPVLLPGGQSQIRLVRSEFEGMIDDGVQQTIEALKRALQAADTDAGDLAAILLIGGSSRIPLVAQLLSAEFNRPIAIDADPKASISLGAAFSAAAMLAPVTAAAQAAPASPASPASPAAPGEVSGGEAAAGEADLHSHGHRFRTDIGTSAPVASAKPAHPRTGARMTAVAAAVATLTILTATAAQSPAEMNPLAAGAAGAQASEEEGAAGTTPPGGAAGPQGSGAGGPAGIQALDGSGGTPITDNWQAVDANGDPAAGTAPEDGTAGTGNNDVGKATPPKGSTPGTNALSPDSPSSTPKPTTKGTSPSTAKPSQPAQEPAAPAPQPESPAQPPATQPPTTAEPPVTPAPEVPQTPVPEPPAPEQTAPASDPPAPAPAEPAPPEPAPAAPTTTELAADPVPSAPAPEVPETTPAPAPEG
ncbi:Hsp70 family protein [Arthrobacter sp. VKM Ac-2550]|uniref:Hsp70 family protein n=1 Tax=Crystallibacter permensis TaxID=1938888 RepID=UPI002227FB42|nr:Hsp70 family protein [Arthrobacter sp. VKM Ac-2550]MCW2134684.1 Hsp70 protein [Arthrobacter sp. VKM Ac-2550]